jgi:hypothetical protein
MTTQLRAPNFPQSPRDTLARGPTWQVQALLFSATQTSVASRGSSSAFGCAVISATSADWNLDELADVGARLNFLSTCFINDCLRRTLGNASVFRPVSFSILAAEAFFTDCLLASR